MPREISVGAVVFRRQGNKIYYLLLHYEAGHWGFPKGHIEKGENEKETLIREIKEETGLEDIKIISGFKEYIKYIFRNVYKLEKKEKTKASWVFKIVIYYLIEVRTKEVKISFEHTGYKWLEYQEALKCLTFKNTKEVLKKAHKFLLKNIKKRE